MNRDNIIEVRTLNAADEPHVYPSFLHDLREERPGTLPVVPRTPATTCMSRTTCFVPSMLATPRIESFACFRINQPYGSVWRRGATVWEFRSHVSEHLDEAAERDGLSLVETNAGDGGGGAPVTRGRSISSRSRSTPPSAPALRHVSARGSATALRSLARSFMLGRGQHWRRSHPHRAATDVSLPPYALRMFPNNEETAFCKRRDRFLDTVHRFHRPCMNVLRWNPTVRPSHWASNQPASVHAARLIIVSPACVRAARSISRVTGTHHVAGGSDPEGTVQRLRRVDLV